MCAKATPPLAEPLAAEFGPRAEGLLLAMLRPKRYAAWANPFSGGGGACSEAFLAEHGYAALPGAAGSAAHIFTAPPELDADAARLPKPPTCPETGLKLYYPLDLASVMPVLALLGTLGGVAAAARPPRRLRFLDACAAPGGKFLIAAGALLAGDAAGRRLFAVERDRFRYNRLLQNVRLYLPERLKPHVRCIEGDTAAPDFARRGGTLFDAILVDAPCSSERERLLREASRRQGPGTRSGSDTAWSRVKAKENSRRQVKLLRAALANAAPGARVVYSTCALSHIENDRVVEKALHGVPPGWQCHAHAPYLGAAVGSGAGLALPAGLAEVGEALGADATSFGWHILPDRGGWGPIYWSQLDGPGGA